jgi:uncharacterized protein (TIGR02246 family)
MQTFRRRIAPAIPALLAALALVGCDGGAGATGDAASAAAEVTGRWSEAFAAGDASKLAALYTEDARSTPPSGPAIAGRAAIESYWRADIGRGGVKTILKPADALVDGNVLQTDGTYEVVGADGGALARGQYQQLWTRVDSGWQVHREMWRLDPGLQRTNELADQLTERWTTFYNAGDAPGLGALYDGDAALSTAAEGTFNGRPAIQAFWADDFGGGKPVSTLTVNDVYAAGDLTHLEGDYTVLDEGKTTKGRYIQLWMRDENGWRIHREMWWR